MCKGVFFACLELLDYKLMYNNLRKKLVQIYLKEKETFDQWIFKENQFNLKIIIQRREIMYAIIGVKGHINGLYKTQNKELRNGVE